MIMKNYANPEYPSRSSSEKPVAGLQRMILSSARLRWKRWLNYVGRENDEITRDVLRAMYSYANIDLRRSVWNGCEGSAFSEHRSPSPFSSWTEIVKFWWPLYIISRQQLFKVSSLHNRISHSYKPWLTIQLTPNRLNWTIPPATSP